MSNEAKPIAIEPCPGCRVRAAVLPDALGKDVQCPSCATVYHAVEVPPVEEPRSPRRSDRRAADDYVDDNEYERPRRKSRSRRVESKRVLAGILAITLGSFGVHKFYLGYTTAGLLHLLLLCVGVSHIIGLVEGIIYLTKTDEDFIDTYQYHTKEWF